MGVAQRRGRDPLQQPRTAAPGRAARRARRAAHPPPAGRPRPPRASAAPAPARAAKPHGWRAGTRPARRRAAAPRTRAPRPTGRRATGRRRSPPAAAPRPPGRRAAPGRSPAARRGAPVGARRRSATSSAARCGSGSASSSRPSHRSISPANDELGLRLARPRDEHPQPALRGEREAGLPERRLPDPRLAAQDQRRRLERGVQNARRAELSGRVRPSRNSLKQEAGRSVQNPTRDRRSPRRPAPS